MSAPPGAWWSVTASPAAAPSISTSCSEPEPTLSPKAPWPENEKEEYIFTINILSYNPTGLDTCRELNSCCNCILCTVNKMSFILQMHYENLPAIAGLIFKNRIKLIFILEIKT